MAPPRRSKAALAALLTHLHRDHADAGALEQGLAPGAPIHHPHEAGGEALEELGLAQAEGELSGIENPRTPLSPWESSGAGSFSMTALPAVDGLGDPQVSWLVEAQEVRVLHLGDTIPHGYWWRMALRHGPFDVVFTPINGAVIDFPHRKPPSPLPATMGPEDAALAGELLGAKVVVPMHYGAYAIEPYYRPVEDAERRFLEAAADRPYETRVLGPGEEMSL